MVFKKVYLLMGTDNRQEWVVAAYSSKRKAAKALEAVQSRNEMSWAYYFLHTPLVLDEYVPKKVK
jgi:hypothetical protein